MTSHPRVSYLPLTVIPNLDQDQLVEIVGLERLAGITLITFAFAVCFDLKNMPLFVLIHFRSIKSDQIQARWWEKFKIEQNNIYLCIHLAGPKCHLFHVFLGRSNTNILIYRLTHL